MTLMRAVVMTEPGAPEVLVPTEVERPAKVNSEFLIEVHAAAINPIEAKTRAGRGVIAGIPSFPAVLGSDFSGVVVEAPYEAHPLQPGTEVYGMMPTPRVAVGSYAEYIAAPVLSVAKKPANLSHVEAAAVPLAGMTAWGAVVDVARAHEGQRMLIHAGSGGVGHFAVQFAAYFGAHVITTGSARNLDFLRELGAAEVIDYTATRFEQAIDEVDVVIDLIGNVHDDTGTRSLEVLRPGGLLVNIPTGSWPTFMQDAEAAGKRATSYKVAPSAATLEVITRLIEAGDVKPHIDQVFPLDQAAAAHTALEGGHTRGKIVLQVR